MDTLTRISADEILDLEELTPAAFRRAFAETLASVDHETAGQPAAWYSTAYAAAARA